MVTVLWSIGEALVVKWMEPGHRFNPTYFPDEMINELVGNLKALGKFQD
jgi:hypothetical protein